MGTARSMSDEFFASPVCLQLSGALARGNLLSPFARSRFPDRMGHGRSGWLQIWLILTVMWSIVIAALGWINLPRAQHIPHDPALLNKLPNEASLILLGDESKTKSSRQGEPMWSDARIIVPMPNGARLTLPASTTHKQVALVKDEYHKLLEAEASVQTGPYVRGMIVAWLLPCPALLVLGLATDLACRFHKSGTQKNISESTSARPITRHGAVRPAARSVPIAFRLLRENNMGIKRKPCSLLKIVTGPGAEHEV